MTGTLLCTFLKVIWVVLLTLSLRFNGAEAARQQQLGPGAERCVPEHQPRGHGGARGSDVCHEAMVKELGARMACGP